jgi:excinuclease ABC subunit C
MIDESMVGNLPEAPGVYLFKDGDRNIIYVGKAKSLRDRVRSYLREGDKDGRLVRLVRSIEDLDIILTTSEKEAFLLENNLIKEHRPKYNVNLKDDKSYASLKLSVGHRYPALTVTRTIEHDGSLYFGPYAQVRDMREVLKIVQAFYPVRRCRDAAFRKRKRPCMLFQVGKCLGPCSGEVAEDVYAEVVRELTAFLQGRNEELLKGLALRIEEEARSWNFEAAAKLKERYGAIKVLLERQSVHEHLGRNRDVWAFMETEKCVEAVLLTFRGGLLIQRRNFEIPGSVSLSDEAVPSFLFQYYSARAIPDEVALSAELQDMDGLEACLRELKHGPLRLSGPSARGVRAMIDLALENLHGGRVLPLDDAFQRVLRLRKRPSRIEVYDISHTGGTSPTGVMVAFEHFKAKKAHYRVFHVREASSLDDPAMMAEVLERRLSGEKMPPLPDLIVIDGGRGQLSAVGRVVGRAALPVDVIGIAKGEGRRRMEETVYALNRKNPIVLPGASVVLKELVKMRDEAHRFAVASHRRWKRRQDLS